MQQNIPGLCAYQNSHNMPAVIDIVWLDPAYLPKCAQKGEICHSYYDRKKENGTQGITRVIRKL